MKAMRIAAWVLGLLAGGMEAGYAAIVTAPPGLGPNDSYRLVFVTSQTFAGSSSNAADYNQIVTAAANSVPELAALGTTWTAIVSTQTVDAKDNTGTNDALDVGVPFFRLDGLRLAQNNFSFWFAVFLEQSIAVNELGGPTPMSVQSSTGISRPWVWTGSSSGGTKSVSSTMGTGFPVAGIADTTVGVIGSSWIGLAITPAADTHALYAVSGVLRTPEPAGAGSMLIAAVGVAFGRRKRRR